jgi:Ca2+-binding EF-hand superfamily protein
LIDLIRRIDKKQTGFANFEQVVLGTRELEFNFSYQEVYTLIKSFDTEGNWTLNVKLLYETLGGA